jgi:1-acyl-sn-glycerol-3-phosphate acyltransferase
LILIRSLAFNVLGFLWTAGLTIVCVPLLAGPRRWSAFGMRLWSAGLAWLLERVVGLGYEVRGREHLPQGGGLVASNHQSAWETVIFQRFLHDAAFVLKRELLLSPNGLYAWRSGSIPIDRSGGGGALRAMVKAAQARIARGQTVVIFPEGTRTASGTRRPYHPGVAALYAHLGVPVTPIALNSGLFWARKSFLKRPGTVLVEVLPAIPPGLERASFMRRLGETIQTAADRLRDEGLRTNRELR